MRGIFKYMLISSVLFFSNVLIAQQEVGLAFSINHMNIFNPAYAGINNETLFKSSIRKQWAGVEYAPETQIVSFTTPLGKNLNMGASIVNDMSFVEKETFVGIDLSYKVQLDSVSNLYFGIKGGGANYSLNLAGLETYNVISDPSLQSFSKFNPNFGIGMVYTRNSFYASLSVPKILNTTKVKNNEGVAALFSDSPHFYFASGYDFSLDTSNYLTLKPSLLLRYVNGVPLSYDINTMLNINNIFEFGMMYRSEFTYAGKAIIIVSKKLQLGFAYEFANKELANAGNTNEFFLQFKF